MARTSLKEPQLKSWEAVNQTLASIAELNREIELEQSACNEKVDQLKTVSKEKIKPLLDRVKANELKLKEFCEARKSEFTQIKTKKLTHGSVGYRLSTTVSIPDPVFTCQVLKQLELEHCIRTKTEPDKEAIKQLSPEQIAEIGASVNTRNTFGYDIETVDTKATAAH
ncbi:host-nuclease inhibitor Gam family protein [Acinetobacter junii]|uniref:host-nuclease inhibitor Gam family protein n=1 Tax=Acinetobacter junii TaxID=40215 RepID=UPI0028543EDD|nr:host-nuclease inhibitor Gam family protein [Acinetobacter junii]MDR7653706.1 host-nuclease inhibitor Gam family protein [Acinetobacter junii]